MPSRSCVFNTVGKSLFSTTNLLSIASQGSSCRILLLDLCCEHLYWAGTRISSVQYLSISNILLTLWLKGHVWHLLQAYNKNVIYFWSCSVRSSCDFPASSYIWFKLCRAACRCGMQLQLRWNKSIRTLQIFHGNIHYHIHVCLFSCCWWISYIMHSKNMALCTQPADTLSRLSTGDMQFTFERFVLQTFLQYLFFSVFIFSFWKTSYFICINYQIICLSFFQITNQIKTNGQASNDTNKTESSNFVKMEFGFLC